MQRNLWRCACCVRCWGKKVEVVGGARTALFIDHMVCNRFPDLLAPETSQERASRRKKQGEVERSSFLRQGFAKIFAKGGICSLPLPLLLLPLLNHKLSPTSSLHSPSVQAILLLVFHFPFEFAVGLPPSNSQPPRMSSSEDEDGPREWAQALLPPLTDRPVNLTVAPNSTLFAPRQYVWVQRTGSQDPRMPDDTSLVDVVEPMSADHEFILQFDILRICLLKRPESDVPVPYLRWDLLNDADSHVTFWRKLGCPDDMMKRYFGPTVEQTMAALQPIFVAAHNGGPFGRWLFHIPRRKNQAQALLVQAFGER